MQNLEWELLDLLKYCIKGYFKGFLFFFVFLQVILSFSLLFNICRITFWNMENQSKDLGNKNIWKLCLITTSKLLCWPDLPAFKKLLIFLYDN